MARVESLSDVRVCPRQTGRTPAPNGSPCRAKDRLDAGGVTPRPQRSRPLPRKRPRPSCTPHNRTVREPRPRRLRHAPCTLPYRRQIRLGDDAGNGRNAHMRANLGNGDIRRLVGRAGDRHRGIRPRRCGTSPSPQPSACELGDLNVCSKQHHEPKSRPCSPVLPRSDSQPRRVRRGAGRPRPPCCSGRSPRAPRRRRGRAAP